MHDPCVLVAEGQGGQERPDHVPGFFLVVGRLGDDAFEELPALAKFHHHVHLVLGGGLEQVVDLDDAIVLEGLEDGVLLHRKGLGTG